MKKEFFKRGIFNASYFILVFIVAFGISTQALVRRVNTYETSKEPVVFSVQKERVSISNSVVGRVESIPVSTGQHVRKGDLLVRLADDSLASRLGSLEELAEDNISARTELALLESKRGDYEIQAPRDGVIYEIQAAEGSYLGMNSSILVLLADSDVKLTGMVNQKQYEEIQSKRDLDVYSSRFEQIYPVTFSGVGRVQPATTSEESRYEVKFYFRDPDDGAAFIDGEGLEVVSSTNDSDHALRPSERIAEFWNKLIIREK